MAGSTENRGLSIPMVVDNLVPKNVVLGEQFCPVVVSYGHVNGGREIMPAGGWIMHNMCLEVTEPDANDEFSNVDKEADMASILARYRKNLLERARYFIGYS